MKRQLRLYITLITLSLTIPSTALAQGPEPQLGTPTMPTMPSWDQIPDVIEFVSLVVPQCCDSCPDGTFYCVFLDILQLLANLLSLMINTVVAVLNSIAKIIIWLWFGLRVVFWQILSFINILIEIINNIYGFILWVIDALRIVLQFLWKMIILIIDIVRLVISLISYITAIAFFLVEEIIEYILHGDNVPLIVEETGTHVAYATLRGIIDAFLNKMPFLFEITISSCYVSWGIWLLRYLPK